MKNNERQIAARLGRLDPEAGSAILRAGLRGLEKETLRVDRRGQLSTEPHPPALGSALTHAYLTTDYSEALLEFVTPPCVDNAAALQFLDELHLFVHKRLGAELLWPPSMPCIIDADEAVPIAQYGSSNEGRFRTVYRSGLGLRYGRSMQAIAGAHFNYSPQAAFWPALHEAVASPLPLVALKSERFMGLVRNYRRVAWLVAYLYGASPAFCKSFRPAGHPRLVELDAHTWHAPFGTSLRMSDMGYRNTTQAKLRISANSLSEYVSELRAAVSTPDPAFERIGVCVDGEYRQLNANVLQIENEYYSSIRPKPASRSLRPTAALARDGVEYVEIRTLDLNPFAAAGIDEQAMALLELLLLGCLLGDSPPITDEEQDEIDARELLVAWEGRRAGLKLHDGGVAAPLRDLGLSILGTLDPIADRLAADAYRAALTEARSRLRDPERTPSARLVRELAESGRSFFEFGLDLAEAQHAHYLALDGDPRLQSELEAEAERSLAAQAALEAAEQPDFGAYLAAYMAAGS